MFTKDNDIIESDSVQSNIRFVAKDTIIYGLASIFSKSVTLITFPLLARHFTVVEYGIVDMFTILIVFLTTLAMMGQDSAIARYYNEEESFDGQKLLISKSLLLQLSLSIVLIPIFWILKNIFIEKFEFSFEIHSLANIILITLPFSIIIANAQGILRFSFNRNSYLALSIGFAVASMIVVLLATLLLEATVLMLFQLYLTVNILFASLGLYLIWKWLIIPKKFLTSHQMLYYAVPMGLIVLLGIGQPLVERLISKIVLGPESLGLYAAGAKISMLISLPIGAFQTSFGPFLMTTYKKANATLTLNVLLKIFVFVLSIIVLVLALSSNYLISILAGERYLESAVVVFPLSLALFIQAIGLFLGIGTILNQKTYYRLISYIISFIVSLVLMFQLGTIYGINGIAISVVFGKLFMLVLESIIGQRLWPLEWEYLVILVMILNTFILGYLFTEIVVYSYLGLSVIVLSFFYLITISWLLTKPEERMILKSLLSQSE